jgi:hypothetical protein
MTHKLDEYIEHMGVKGMKWGVRKGTVSGKIKPRTTLSLIDRLEQRFIDNAQTSGYTRVYRKAQRKIRGMTRQLNNDPKFKGKNFKKDSPLRKEYYKSYADMVAQQLNASVNTRLILRPYRKAGQSITRKFELHFNSFDVAKELRPTAVIRRTPSRQAKLDNAKTAKIDRKIKGYAGPFSTTIKHSIVSEEDDFPEEGVTVSFEIDETGHILDMLFPGEDTLQQVMDWTDNFLSHREEFLGPIKKDGEELIHWGILGMRWGVRKNRNSLNANDSHSKSDMSDDDLKSKINRIELENKYKNLLSQPHTKNPTDAELQGRINRMELEKKYSEISRPKMSAGKKILAGVLIGAATAVASEYLKEFMKAGVNKALGRNIKDTSQKVVKETVNVGVTDLVKGRFVRE